MANVYDIGDRVRISCEFTRDGYVTDPTTITVKVKNPAGTVTTATYALAEVTKAGTGSYYYDMTITAAGVYWYRWEATGTLIAASEDSFIVRTSNF